MLTNESDERERAEKALNGLAEFHKRQRDLDWERRKKRNNEVDALISQLGDPKVAEKLRIYRLVEEQFLHIEAEVEKEVKQKMDEKKKSIVSHDTGKSNRPTSRLHSVGKLPGGSLLHKAKIVREQLASQLENTEPPAPIKDNLAKLKAERQLQAKEKLLGRKNVSSTQENSRKNILEKISYRSEPVSSIPESSVKTQGAKKKVFMKPQRTIQRNEPIKMLSEPIIKDLSSEKPKKGPDNVGFATFYDISERESVSQKVLTAHVLRGVNITPKPTLKESSPLQTKIIEELHESLKDETSSKTSTSTVMSNHLASPIFHDVIPQVSMPYENNSEVFYDLKCDETKDETDDQQDNKVLDEKSNQSDDNDYSENFEDEEVDDFVENVLPKILETQATFLEEDSAAGRLSTIPEVPSQATSSSSLNKVQTDSKNLSEGPLETSSDTSFKSNNASPIQLAFKETSKEASEKDETHETSMEARPAIKSPESIPSLSLSEGPFMISEDSSILVQPQLVKSQIPANVLSEGPLDSTKDEEKSEKFEKSTEFQKSKQIQTELNQTSSSISKSANISAIASSVKAPSTSSDSTTTSYSKLTSQSLSSKESSDFSEGQFLVFRGCKNNLGATSSDFSEGEIPSKDDEQLMENLVQTPDSLTSPQDSLDDESK